jgi:hypothetical protein
MTKPAIVAPKERIWRALAGGRFEVPARWRPLTPRAIMKTTRMGIHAYRSYLRGKVEKGSRG